MICSSVRSSATTHGTVFNPSRRAAFSRVCPATMTPALSITIGTLNPNSLIEAATALTAWSFFLGFLAYGISSAICLSMTSICSPSHDEKNIDYDRFRIIFCPGFTGHSKKYLL